MVRFILKLVANATNYILEVNMRHVSGYISVLHRFALQFYNRAENETGLRGVQYPYLFYICRHEGCRQDEIAKHLHVNKSNVTRQIEKLKNAEMIEIRKDSEDERVCRVYPTEKLLKSRETVVSVIEDWNKIILKNLSEDETEQLKELLDKALQGAKESEE